MRAIVGFGLVSFCAALLCAQPAAPDKCRLEGKVLNSLTGEGLRKVRVELTPIRDGTVLAVGRTLSAATDPEGRFVFTSLDAGSYAISAQRDGFQDSRQAASRPQTVKLAPGDLKDGVIVRMAPMGVISGHVRDEDGDPVRGAMVGVAIYYRGSSGAQYSERASGTTNDLGEYRIYDVPRGKYYVRAQPRVGTEFDRNSRGNEMTLGTFYPGGALDIAAASQVQVRPGDELRGIDLTLRRIRGAAVRGRARKPAGLNSAELVSVEALPLSGAGFMRGNGSSSDPEGNFEIRPLAPGSYLLSAQVSIGSVRYAARLPVEVGSADIEGIELRPSPPVQVNGILRVEGDAKVRLSQIDVYLSGQRRGASGKARDDGSFTIKDVEPGSYRILFNLLQPPATSGGLRAPLYLKSARCGSVDVGEAGVEVAAGAPCDLSITLSANGGQIRGRVEREEQEDAPGVSVMLIADAPNRSPVQTSSTDENGEYSFIGIAPGTYKLFAWERGSVEYNNTVIYDQDFLKDHANLGQTVRISEKATETPGPLKVIKAPKDW